MFSNFAEILAEFSFSFHEKEQNWRARGKHLTGLKNKEHPRQCTISKFQWLQLIFFWLSHLCSALHQAFFGSPASWWSISQQQTVSWRWILFYTGSFRKILPVGLHAIFLIISILGFFSSWWPVTNLQWLSQCPKEWAKLHVWRQKEWYSLLPTATLATMYFSEIHWKLRETGAGFVTCNNKLSMRWWNIIVSTI